MRSRLLLRRGAGPLSARRASSTSRPRPYQLVPLHDGALRMRPVPRLLIADESARQDDRSLADCRASSMDRGEWHAFAVLCPPHLVEQWVGELKARFDRRRPVTSGTARDWSAGCRWLQRCSMPIPSQSFQPRLHQGEKRRDEFRAQPAPIRSSSTKPIPAPLVTLGATNVISWSNARERRRSACGAITATPHSGDETPSFACSACSILVSAIEGPLRRCDRFGFAIDLQGTWCSAAASTFANGTTRRCSRGGKQSTSSIAFMGVGAVSRIRVDLLRGGHCSR